MERAANSPAMHAHPHLRASPAAEPRTPASPHPHLHSQAHPRRPQHRMVTVVATPTGATPGQRRAARQGARPSSQLASPAVRRVRAAATMSSPASLRALVQLTEALSLSSDYTLGPEDSLSVLPTELGLRICAFLGPADLCRLSATNRRWRSICSDGSLWRGACKEMEFFTSPARSPKQMFCEFRNIKVKLHEAAQPGKPRRPLMAFNPNISGGSPHHLRVLSTLTPSFEGSENLVPAAKGTGEAHSSTATPSRARRAAVPKKSPPIAGLGRERQRQRKRLHRL